MGLDFKSLAKSLSIGVGAGLILAASGVQASPNEAALIEKFTHVYLRLAPNDSSKTGVTLRLADLHSERARKLSAEDMLAGEKDRRLALQYYREAVAKTPEENQARIWIQMGHLHEMNGDSSGALKAYEQVMKLPSSPEQKAEAHLAVAEVYFKQRNFPKAQAEYAQVVGNEKANSRGFAAYRSAWVDFNLGRTEAAIDGLVKILKAPELLRRSSTPAGSVDKQFQEEVSRDLATFMAKRRVQESDLNLLFELSPRETQVSNLMYLAGEAERLGQSNEALKLWQFVYEKQSDPKERLESLIHIGSLQVSRGEGEAAIVSYESALQLWNTLGCTDDKLCAELKMRIKNTLVDWNRLEKKNPSEQLVRAYQAYTQAFPEDMAMRMYLAQVAREKKNLKLAYETYAAMGQLKSEHQEPALLSAIETAEMMVSDAAAKAKAAGTAKVPGPSDEELLLKRSYDLYVLNSPKKDQLAQVQYQQAKWLYDAGEMQPAATALREYALSNDKELKNKPELREQAANLSLDALAILKDDVRIREWSEDFAKAFPKTADDKRAIGRKALMNQAAQLAESKDNAGAWALLGKETFAGASADERIQLLKNKLVLSEKLGLYSQARLISDELLAQAALKEEDRQYALSRKAWLSELVLDFDGALTATEKMKVGDVAPDQRLLKLAMYADLASKEPRNFYMQYLKVSKDNPSKVAIASQLVKASKEPLKEIATQNAVLAADSEVLAQLYLEVYGQTRSPEALKKALSQPALVKTKAGALLQRQEFLKSYKDLNDKLAAMQIDGSSQKKMAAGLKARVQMLSQGEKLANQVIGAGDWTAQVAVLTSLAKENERFYSEIMALPLPEGLTPEQEQEYMQALAETASPHQTKAKDLTAKVSEFWANPEAVSQLEKSLDLATVEVRPLIVDEIKLLETIAPEGKKASLTAALNRPTAIVAEKPSLQIIETARAAVRENPMDKQSLSNLLELETKWGKPAMVSYLKGRIEALKDEKTN